MKDARTGRASFSGTKGPERSEPLLLASVQTPR